MNERTKFERQLGQLRTIILDGLSYYIVWQALNQEYERPVPGPGLRTGFWWQYRGFLAPARKALFFSTLMQFSKAYDSDHRNISVRRLLKSALENPEELAPHATRGSLATMLDRIDRNTELLEQLRQYRNRRLAHYDPDFQADIEFPSEDFDTIVEETKSIYNSIRSFYQGQSDDFDEIMRDVSLHTSQIITLISETERPG